ncbi:hypothetical protein Tco_1060993 [Tanacetum coccineum]
MLNAQAEAMKEGNVKEENLCGMNKDFKTRPNGHFVLRSGVGIKVGFQRISLTGFRSCASRSQTRASQSRQSTE